MKHGTQTTNSPRILVVGAGGLGCAVCMALAKHISTDCQLLVCDPDTVELSNLNRQILFGDTSIGQPKSSELVKRLQLLHPNPNLTLTSIKAALSQKTADELLKNVSIVVDACDSATDKFLINSLCVDRGITLVHGAGAGLRGQAMLFHPEQACLACVFEPPAQEESIETEQNCQQAGIFGAFIGMIGLAQAQLVLEALAGSFPSKLFYFTMQPWHQGSIDLTRNPDCAVCASSGDKNAINSNKFFAKGGH